MKPSEMQSKVEKSLIYIEWKKTRPDAFLSSIFTMLGKGPNWSLNYFNPKTQKMSTFTLTDPIDLATGQEIVGAGEPPKPIKLDSELLDPDKIIDAATAELNAKYMQHSVTKGMAALQVIDGVQLWNVTFFTSLLKAINIRVEQDSGKIISSEIISIMDIQSGERK